MPKTVFVTPNQAVAFRLRTAREARRLTQREAATRISHVRGERWTVATLSAAERSFPWPNETTSDDLPVDRVRQFTPDDLFAFAEVFAFPVAWFLMPPESPHEFDRPLPFTVDYQLKVGQSGPLDAAAAVERALYASDEFFWQGTLGELVDPATGRVTEWQQKFGGLVAFVVATKLHQQVDLGEWSKNLREIADLFESLRRTFTAPSAQAAEQV